MLLTIHIISGLTATTSLGVLFYIGSLDSKVLVIANLASSLAVFGTGVGLLFQGADLTRTCLALGSYLLLQVVVYRRDPSRQYQFNKPEIK